MSSLIAAPFLTSIGGEGLILEFDSTPRETHSGQTTPTDHPVEDGVIVSDHAIDSPDEVEISGIVSNRPIVFLASQNAKPSTPSGDPRTRAEDFYNAIRDLRKRKILVTLASEIRNYESMLLVAETVQRDARTGKILDITVRLREFRVATVQTVEAPVPVDTADAPVKKKGKKQKKPVEQSALNKLFNLAGGQ